MPVAWAKPSCSDLPASSFQMCARIRKVLTEPSSSMTLSEPRATTGSFVLADLIALRQIGIKVILARKYRAACDRGVDANPNLTAISKRAREHGNTPDTPSRLNRPAGWAAPHKRSLILEDLTGSPPE